MIWFEGLLWNLPGHAGLNHRKPVNVVDDLADNRTEDLQHTSEASPVKPASSDLHVID